MRVARSDLTKSPRRRLAMGSSKVSPGDTCSSQFTRLAGAHLMMTSASKHMRKGTEIRVPRGRPVRGHARRQKGRRPNHNQTQTAYGRRFRGGQGRSDERPRDPGCALEPEADKAFLMLLRPRGDIHRLACGRWVTFRAQFGRRRGVACQ